MKNISIYSSARDTRLGHHCFTIKICGQYSRQEWSVIHLQLIHLSHCLLGQRLLILCLSHNALSSTSALSKLGIWSQHLITASLFIVDINLFLVHSYNWMNLFPQVTHSKDVKQKDKGKDHEEAPSARDFQCLCYVWSVPDPGVQRSLQHDWPEQRWVCGQGGSSWHARLTG